MRKLLVGSIFLALASFALAGFIHSENHQHTETNAAELAHSASIDRRGGHNCSREAKRKDLCDGYHRHQ